MEKERKETWRAEEEIRRTEYNQRAGERFNDWWMFGDDKALRRLFKMFR